MTEVRGNYLSADDAWHEPSYIAPVNALIRYTPSSEVLEAIGDVLNDKGAEILAKKGLLLSSRMMRFQNSKELLTFRARHIAPRITHSTDDLSRVGLTPENDWKPVNSRQGEAYRVFLHVEPHQAVALEGLYAHYIEERLDNSKLIDGTQGEMMSRSLSFNLPIKLAAFNTPEEGVEGLKEKLAERRQKGGVLYAHSPHPADDPVKPQSF